MEELNESELGTQEYWNSHYKKEIANFNTHGDPGEIWFGEDIVDRIIRWLNNCESVDPSDKILDVGCGNGMLLVDLAREGFTNLHGVDYSDPAITLAKSVASKDNMIINYRTCNILEGLGDKYKIILDKGTYDAVSLSADASKNRELYIENISKSLEDGGFFVITSCNWTESELNEHFGDHFEFSGVIPTPQFKFGGKVGSVVSSVIYKKK